MPYSAEYLVEVDVESEMIIKDVASEVSTVQCVPEEKDEEEDTDVMTKDVAHTSECVPEEEEEDEAEMIIKEVAPTTSTARCIPEEEDEEREEKVEKIVAATSAIQMMGVVAKCVPEEEEEEVEEMITKKSVAEVAAARGEEVDHPIDDSGDSFLVQTDPETAPAEQAVVVLETEAIGQPQGPQRADQELQFTLDMVEVDSGSETPEEGDQDVGDQLIQEVPELMSPEDPCDSSSVDSFATVVNVQDEEDEDEEDRLAEIASMTSSFHSDFQPVNPEDTTERMEEEEGEEEDLQETDEILEWSNHEDRDRESESSLDSDRYEFIDRNALSVITEISDEDRFEMIERDELESECGSSDHIHSSPDGIPIPSPGANNLKFFSRSGEKDDVSVSSSLLEFERLEREINQSSSVSSIENVDKDSLCGSYDEKKFFGKSSDRDDISITSSLAEFERFEREIAQGGSTSSIDKMTPDSKSSGGEGSISSSLAEFEKIEAEISQDGDERRGSVESVTRRSETSSQASLNEFERLEREIVIAEELEAEAQKIVSILESGSLMSYQTDQSYQHMGIQQQVPRSSSDIDKDSLDGKEEVDRDSLSEGDKQGQGADADADADSLDGDTSEMTEMTSSVIFTGADLTVAQTTDAPVREIDADSLQGESLMQLSADSLTMEQRLDLSKSESDRCDADSLQEQEGLMEKSSDSMDLAQKTDRSDKYDRDSLAGQEDLMQSSADSLELNDCEQQSDSAMQISVESAAWSMGSSGISRSSDETMKSSDIISDSSQTHDLMQVSAESAENWKLETESKSKVEYQKESEVIYETRVTQSHQGKSMTIARAQYSSSALDSEDIYQSDDSYSTYSTDSQKSQIYRPGATEEGMEGELTEKPYMTWGPYQESKKVFTMVEWEAMKEAKRKAKEESGDDTSPTQELSSTQEQITTQEQTTTHSEHSHTTISSTTTVSFSHSSSSSHPACSPPTSDSQASSVLSPPEGHGSKSRADREEDVGSAEEAEDEGAGAPDSPTDSLNGSSVDGTQTTKLVMKKEIHKKTMIGRDGQEETFVREDTQIQQEHDPPEELRDSMQEIINQFMETTPQTGEFEQQHFLEDDV